MWSFKYLGSMVMEDGSCRTEIKVRIALAKEAFNKKKELLTLPFKIYEEDSEDVD